MRQTEVDTGNINDVCCSIRIYGVRKKNAFFPYCTKRGRRDNVQRDSELFLVHIITTHIKYDEGCGSYILYTYTGCTCAIVRVVLN